MQQSVVAWSLASSGPRIVKTRLMLEESPQTVKVLIYYEPARSVLLELHQSSTVLVAIHCALDYIAEIQQSKPTSLTEHYNLYVATRSGGPEEDLPPFAKEQKISLTNIKAFYLRLDEQPISRNETRLSSMQYSTTTTSLADQPDRKQHKRIQITTRQEPPPPFSRVQWIRSLLGCGCDRD